MLPPARETARLLALPFPLCYGRPLSLSGRPCYILPMFFIYLFIFFMAALFSGPG